MPFQKGHSGNPNGKPKGSANKTTIELRETFQKILKKNIRQIQSDLQQLEPKDRLRIILQMSEFIIPKLQRTQLAGGENIHSEENFIILSDGTKIPF
jgi:hypothetical protein